MAVDCIRVADLRHFAGSGSLCWIQINLRLIKNIYFFNFHVNFVTITVL